MSKPFAGLPLYQVAYVTSHLEKGIKHLKLMREIQTKDLGPTTIPVDPGGSVTIRMAMGFVGPVIFEVIEPVGGNDDIYRNWLSGTHSHELVFHHIAYRAHTLDELEEVRSRCVENGLPVVMTGGIENRGRFFYADATAMLGHYIEYVYVTPERLRFQIESLPHTQ